MSLDGWNTVAAMGTFLVILATAIAAIVQLRHLQRGNWLAVQLKILEMWNSEAIQEPYNYIKTVLPEKLKDPAYRAELEYGPIDRSVHREMVMLDWNAQLGLLLEKGALDDTFLQFYQPAVVVCWKQLAPVLALIRRQRDIHGIEHFDYLVARMTALAEKPPRDIFARLTRPRMTDEWLAIDHPRSGPE
ncbi:MAG TPA: hypothetical protein VIG46_13505 [Candidatus Baltobacteraceae bacterium]|jgi:hypothetical protein